MAASKTPLFVRLPRSQATALDRLAGETGRPKQHLVTEILGDRLTAPREPAAVGRVELPGSRDAGPDEVFTLEEAAAFLKVAVEIVRTRAEDGELPGRRFGGEWRFSRMAILDWLAHGEPPKRRR